MGKILKAPENGGKMKRQIVEVAGVMTGHCV
jgi:hypothetical protein